MCLRVILQLPLTGGAWRDGSSRARFLYSFPHPKERYIFFGQIVYLSCFTPFCIDQKHDILRIQLIKKMCLLKCSRSCNCLPRECPNHLFAGRWFLCLSCWAGLLYKRLPCMPVSTEKKQEEKACDFVVKQKEEWESVFCVLFQTLDKAHSVSTAESILII